MKFSSRTLYIKLQYRCSVSSSNALLIFSLNVWLQVFIVKEASNIKIRFLTFQLRTVISFDNDQIVIFPLDSVVHVFLGVIEPVIVLDVSRAHSSVIGPECGEYRKIPKQILADASLDKNLQR